MEGQTREQIDGQARPGLKMEYYSGCAGVRCCKLWSGGGFKKRKKKKEERRGLSKRDVGPEGRKSRKMVALPTEVEKPEGEAGMGVGVVWSGYVELTGCWWDFQVRRPSCQHKCHAWS